MEVKSIKGRFDYMDVYFDDGCVVRIDGELVHGGFIAEASSIRQWKEPEGEPVSEEEKSEIMDAVTEKTKDSHMVVMFE